MDRVCVQVKSTQHSLPHNHHDHRSLPDPGVPLPARRINSDGPWFLWAEQPAHRPRPPNERLARHQRHLLNSNSIYLFHTILTPACNLFFDIHLSRQFHTQQPLSRFRQRTTAVERPGSHRHSDVGSVPLVTQPSVAPVPNLAGTAIEIAK